MQNWILYARFSPRKNAGDCESIATQLERLRAMAAAMGAAVLAEYCDEEASGASRNGRPGLDQAIAHACKTKAVMAVYSLSRLARNVRDTLDIAEQLDRRGADLFSLHERIDTTCPTGRFFFTILAALNQLEREQISERTSEAMLGHQRRGRRMGRGDRCPFGFCIDPDDPARLIEVADEQEAIRIILGDAAAGMMPRAICRQLDTIGIRRRGKGWAGAHPLVADIIRRHAH